MQSSLFSGYFKSWRGMFGSLYHRFVLIAICKKICRQRHINIPRAWLPFPAGEPAWKMIKGIVQGRDLQDTLHVINNFVVLLFPVL